MKKALKTFVAWFVYIMTGHGEITAEMVGTGVLDLSGQGRNERGD